MIEQAAEQLFRQEESSDAVDNLRDGLVLLARHLGRQTNPSELGDGLALEQGRLPLELVSRSLNRVGINARVRRIALSDIKTSLLPALLLANDGSTLLLVDWFDNDAKVLLPETGGGEQRLSKEELTTLYSGTVIIAKPRYENDSRSENFARETGEHWLRGPLKRCWHIYAEVGVTSLVANLLAVSTALFALQVYDRVIPNDAFETLFVLASGVIIAIVLEFILRSIRTYLLDVTGKRIDLQLSSRLFEQVMQIRLSAKPRSTGVFSNQIREFESVREFFTSSTAATVSDLPFVFVFILLISYIGGPVVWVPVIAMVLMLLPSLLLQSKLAKLSRANLRENAVKNGILLETIDNLETIKATRAEGGKLRAWELLSAKLADDSMRVRRLSAILNHGAGLVQQLCYVSVVIIGVHQISIGELTVGGLIACSILAARMISPMNQFAMILTRWQHVKIAIEGLDSLINAPVERPLGHQFARKSRFYGEYDIANLQYRYADDSPLVLDIDKLHIAPGSRVILLGGNGAGKSSLLRLMSGLSDASSGELLLDNVSLSQIDPADRKQAIGYLPQDIALFYGTLRDNLTLDGQYHEDDELYQALDAVGLGEAVRAHPLGMDLPITGNSSLSGGQRQAVGIVRLLLQDPRIVLMDEPTAAFDQASETHVIRFLQTWLNGRTLIMSTHKRSMLVLGQRGIVLQKGRVMADGPLQDLLRGGKVETSGADDA